jgi:single-stranded-DNA-specific exonuclease
MEGAIERIRRAIDDKEHISIYGDFDVDGISGTALLSHTLGKVGAKITPYIPDRIKDGHGISLRASGHLESEGGVLLLVTVDCGVSSYIETEQALGKGIDTIVTDHHIPPKELQELTLS